MKFFFIVLVSIIVNTFCMAQNVLPSLDWVQSFGSSGHDQGLNLSIDPMGNTYLGGFFRDQVNFNPKYIRWQARSNGSEDIFINKYDKEGRLLWAATFGGRMPDRCMASAVDGNGNVYITGIFRDTVVFSSSLSNGTKIGLRANDAFIAKLSTQGEVLWIKTIQSMNDEQGRTIAVDNNGNVYVSGIFQETAIFEGADQLTLNGYKLYDIWITKLNTAGEFQWSKMITGPAEETVSSMSITSKGEIVLTGSFSNDITINPGPNSISLSQTNIHSDMYIIKLDTDGEALWAKAIRGQNVVTSMSSTVDNLDQLYFTGFFRSKADFDPNNNEYLLTAPGVGGDIFILKLNNNGDLIWVKQLGGNYHDVGLGITVDKKFNVYTTGCFQKGADFDPDVNQYILDACCDTSNNDIFVSKLDHNGKFIWAGAFHGEGEDIGLDLVVDAENRIYSTGLFSKTVDFQPHHDSFNLSSNGFTDIYFHAMSEVILNTNNPALNEDIQIVPIPASNHFDLIVKNAEVQSIELLNSQGLRLDLSHKYSITKDYQTIRFEEVNIYSSGIYFLKIKLRDKTLLKKLILIN